MPVNLNWSPVKNCFTTTASYHNNNITGNHHHPALKRIQRIKLGLVLVAFQCIITVIFVAFCSYSIYIDARDIRNSISPVFGGFVHKHIIHDYNYSLFQDVHVMMFIGFGFLMTFLRRYGYSAVGFNFLLGALMVQWAMICQGFYALTDNYHIELNIISLAKADIATATVLISMGAVLGRTSYIQLLVMGTIEIVFFAGNSYLGSSILKVSDAGGSIFVHTFGAYFGLAVSYMIDRHKNQSHISSTLESARYTSDIFAMIGTIILWLYWPSFNAVEVTGAEQHRAVLNTYLSLASCCVTTFACSLIFTHNHKFDMVHIQNATLAGGVAVGTAANLMLRPFGAVIVGMGAGILSVCGYEKLTPLLRARIGLSDTCGIHNLHGMPGILAGLIGVLMAAVASESDYSMSLYVVYPARAARNQSATADHNFLQPGDGRSASVQAGYQFLAVVVTLIIALCSGLFTGFILKYCTLTNLSHENFYDDTVTWIMPSSDDGHQQTLPVAVETNLTKSDHNQDSYQYDNPSFVTTDTGGSTKINGCPNEAIV